MTDNTLDLKYKLIINKISKNNSIQNEEKHSEHNKQTQDVILKGLYEASMQFKG